LTLKKEYRLKVFENRVLRRIFGQKRDEIMGDWSKMHNEELHNLYPLPNIIRTIKSLHVREEEGRAIAQAVSHRLPTAAARVQTRVWSCEIL
jgi:hypothetical protein